MSRAGRAAFPILFLAAFFLAACARPGGQVLRVGVVPGPQARIVAKVKDLAEREGFFFEAVEYDAFEFADNYIKINTDLKTGKIGLNCFQNRFWLEESNARLGADFVVAGLCYVSPMGVYSIRHKALSGLPAGGTVFVPDDFFGTARALLLLEKAGLVSLSPAAGQKPGLAFVEGNPLGLKITPIDASLLQEGLLAGDVALLSPEYAKAAGLSPEDALFSEGGDSPFAQVMAVRAGRARDPEIIRFVKYYQSEAVRRFIEEEYKGRLAPAWG